MSKTAHLDVDWDVSLLRKLPDYPWLPCPICTYTGSCDCTVLERARAAHPSLHLPRINADGTPHKG